MAVCSFLNLISFRVSTNFFLVVLSIAGFICFYCVVMERDNLRPSYGAYDNGNFLVLRYYMAYIVSSCSLYLGVSARSIIFTQQDLPTLPFPVDCLKTSQNLQ